MTTEAVNNEVLTLVSKAIAVLRTPYKGFDDLNEALFYLDEAVEKLTKCST